MWMSKKQKYLTSNKKNYINLKRGFIPIVKYKCGKLKRWTFSSPYVCKIFNFLYKMKITYKINTIYLIK